VTWSGGQGDLWQSKIRGGYQIAWHLRRSGTAAHGRPYLFLCGLVPGHRLAKAAALHATIRVGHYSGSNNTRTKGEGQRNTDGFNQQSISGDTLIHSKLVYIN